MADDEAAKKLQSVEMNYKSALDFWLTDNTKRYGDIGGGRSNPQAVPVDRGAKPTK